MPTSLRENSESHLKRRKDLLQKDVQVICLDLIPINKVAFTGEFRKHGGRLFLNDLSLERMCGQN